MLFIAKKKSISPISLLWGMVQENNISDESRYCKRGVVL